MTYQMQAKFHEWLRAQGAEVLAATNTYEYARFRARGGVHVVYQNKYGSPRGHGFAGEVLMAFQDKKCMRMGDVQKPRDNMARLKIALRERDGDMCFFCGQTMFDIEGEPGHEKAISDCTLEHLVGRAKGGPDHMDNLVLAHESCNKLAANIPLIEKIKQREKRLCHSQAA